ncbi:LytR/AlgR family response regulator transcription factor [Lutispora sp.]|uniref:LytR/AlgR family response regulator transcription factor n=1 Tax=Lutispora sp. TaxID=2828727 RepID=UPI002B214D33|nr:LytTR family DNA-binding domain-containing protein [Lutispora sp.]MEA4962392.1 LytTR family DNA-binding domain-containing protein [Lutispora sp.]
MHTILNIAVCEDDENDMSRLLSCITESGVSAQCETFSSCETLMTAFLAGRYDLIFLDIYMDEIQQGVDAATKIRETDSVVTLAFTTTSTEHTLESYRLKASSYLEKPVKSADVREVLELALNKKKNIPSVNLLIDGTYRDIPLDSILYFEQQNLSVIVNTLSGELRTSRTVKLKNIEPLLPDNFLRCHHSYIANLKYVNRIDREWKVFTMQNGSNVHIRQQTMKKATEAFENYRLNRTRQGGVR